LGGLLTASRSKRFVDHARSSLGAVSARPKGIFTDAFTRQKPLGAYFADFYCSKARLVIEVNGDSHFTAEAELRDASRTAALEAHVLRLIRFTNAEVMQQFEAVCQRIEDALAEKP